MEQELFIEYDSAAYRKTELHRQGIDNIMLPVQCVDGVIYAIRYEIPEEVIQS